MKVKLALYLSAAFLLSQWAGHVFADTAGKAKQPGFEKAWTAKTGDWNRGIAVTPWGDVVSLASGVLRVHASDNGQILDEIKICYPVENGFGFIDETNAVLICEKEIQKISFPAGIPKKVMKLKILALAAALEGDLVAVADDKRNVTVYSVKKWKVVDSFTADDDVTGLALSHDGVRLAVGLDNGIISMRDLSKKKTKKFWKGGGSSVDALAFSPDDSKLFADSGSFKASVWDVDQGTQLIEYKTGSWLVEARFLSPTLVAATGSDGFVLYEGSGEPQSILNYTDKALPPVAEGLGASMDGKLACAGDRDGTIACFSTSELNPSAYAKMVKADIKAPAPGSGTMAQASLQQVKTAQILGEISGRKGKVITVKVYTSNLPQGGAGGSLFKHFEKKIGSMSMSGWLEIAAVKVKKTESNKIFLEIKKEKSVMKVNGKKVKHFTPGTKVKLEVEAAGDWSENAF